MMRISRSGTVPVVPWGFGDLVIRDRLVGGVLSYLAREVLYDQGSLGLLSK